MLLETLLKANKLSKDGVGYLESLSNIHLYCVQKEAHCPFSFLLLPCRNIAGERFTFKQLNIAPLTFERLEFESPGSDSPWNHSNRFKCSSGSPPRFVKAKKRLHRPNITKLLRPGAPPLQRRLVESDKTRPLSLRSAISPSSSAMVLLGVVANVWVIGLLAGCFSPSQEWLLCGNSLF